MARRGPATGVAGLHQGPAASGVRDEPSAPCGQRYVAARLRRADGVERGRRGANADHGARRPDRLGAQPGIPPCAADERQRPGTFGPSAADRRVTEVTLTDRGRQALQEAAPGHVGLVRRLFFGGLARWPRGAGQPGTGKRVRGTYRTGLAPSARRLASGGGLTRSRPAASVRVCASRVTGASGAARDASDGDTAAEPDARARPLLQRIVPAGPREVHARARDSGRTSPARGGPAPQVPGPGKPGEPWGPTQATWHAGSLLVDTYVIYHVS